MRVPREERRRAKWQTRYYNALFNTPECEQPKYIKNIALNYLEGLEWNLKYYSIGCSDWTWCYKYKYPPLLEDLIKYIPTSKYEFITLKRDPITPIEQLCYVLPQNSLQFLPENIRKKVNPKWYKTDCTFTWAFCKYFWEAHVNLPEIDLIDLKDLIE